MTAQPGAAAPTAPGEAGGRPSRHRRARTFPRALGLTALGAVLPGTAFLAAGRRLLGVLTLLLFVALVGAAAWLATAGRQTAVHLAVSADSLLWVIGGVALVGLLWVLVVVAGYRMLAPRGTRRGQHAVGGLLVLLLAAGVALPAYEVVHLADVQRGLINGVFSADRRSATVVDTPDPFQGKDRVNVLLLGGDSGPGRQGLRTDTVIVASTDTHTGNTTLFSLPRNLENLPFPPDSPLAALYPDGFVGPDEGDSLLTSVYDIGPSAHPGVLGPTDDEGADWLKLGVGQALGLHIDYYVLVNMEGFSRLVDALGGVTVNVNYWVPINGITSEGVLPDDYIAPGPNQHLDGYHALQFARGRFGLTDYDRMARQRCTIGAIIKAADPVTLLSKYQQLAETTENIISTDVPQSALDDFVDLAFQVKDAEVHSVVFDNSVIDPAYPDYDQMRQIVDTALDPSAAASSTAPATATTTPATGSTAPVTAGQTPPPASSPIADVGDACAYDPAQAQAALAAGKPPIRGG
jgi:polyisoprenyl-teichoic acid--peptidoglycan teichoic acid transferase